MTKEEAKDILHRISEDNFYGTHVQEACKIAVETLSERTLPSDLDAAAEEYGRKEYSHAIHFWDEGLSKNKPELMKEDFVESFKAGAEWVLSGMLHKDIPKKVLPIQTNVKYELI